MTISLAKRVSRIKPSPTLALSARAKELKAQGKEIISLAVGEPDFDTPDYIKEAANRAIADGFTKYTAVDGTPELKQAIIDKFKQDNQLDYNAAQILVSSGAKQSIYNLMQAILNPGDEVIIPAPYWVSYPDMALLAEAEPVIINTDINARFKMTPEQLRQAITPKTKLLMLNSPSNPTGMNYSKAELVALAEVLLEHPDIIIMSDDIYEHILWPGQSFTNIVTACPALADRTIVVNGVSKAYSMTGWRIGYAAGPEQIIGAMKKIQSQSTSNPNSIAQVAATTAINGPQDSITMMVTEFKKRHDYVVETLNTLPGVNCIPADGTFYAFPDVSEAINNSTKVNTDMELVELFINEAGVVPVPGSAFGAPGYMRLSFATSMEQLQAACAKMKSVLDNA